MGRKYNTRLIRDDYSYYVEQVADVFGVDVATVRRWMREHGLQRIPHTRPHMIHSSQLKIFLEKQKATRKKPCAAHEVFCLRCQLPRTPKMGSATITILPNTSVRFSAACVECGGKMCRSIKRAEWEQNHPLTTYLSDAAVEHKGVLPLHRKCSLQEEYKDDRI